MKSLSTNQVAKLAEIHPITLERWLSSGKLRGPKVLRVGQRNVRLWSQADVERVRIFKVGNYRKGRGRKKRRP